MELVIILLALGMLMFIAYRGFSVIMFAPLCALFAVFLTDPDWVLPFFSNVFMGKMVEYIKLYFPIFLLGAIFGKVVEMSGLARSIASTLIQLVGRKRAMLVIVLLCAILTYSGISLVVVAFAVYPFAANLFRQSDIPKRLIPGTIALGSFTFTMDALPGSPQVQNVIPTTFFKTDLYAAPTLGIIGAIFIFIIGMLYLNSRRKKAEKAGEGYYSFGTIKEKQIDIDLDQNESIARKILAFVPVVLVGVINKVLTTWIPKWYPNGFDFSKIGLNFPNIETSQVVGIWSVEIALIVGILTTILYNRKPVVINFKDGMNLGIAGALLAIMNSATEYGFGAVISNLPGFTMARDGIAKLFTNPLLNGAVTTNVLSAISGSASAGIAISLGIMADKYIELATQFGIPLEVMHRVISMASGGMDTLPHNGAVITLLAITGLTHKQSYRDIFAVTIIKTIAAFFIIGVYLVTGLV
ncbi:GntP family permease [Bacillus sp. AFS031507]|uniref:GntP family permease n=1 Tax=Bacillus sp. AFS031507 TaxID=2033496 RepID=UPI000BFE9A1F|nr:GntP family permease [Bacillus sp. AFS031507]PGY15758.1 transporter [Bacillus sp. AFS031507]